MATTLNQFSQTMTQSQTQIQLIQDAIIQLANGAQIQAQSNQQMVHDMALIKNKLQSHITPPPPPSLPPPNPPPSLDLKLPAPTHFFGDPSELRSFQLQLCEFLSGSPARYHDDHSRILYSGSTLKGAARKWYEGLMDPSTNRLPPSYTFNFFLDEMVSFFGGGVNILTLERDLANLRQTGSVTDYAISFQTITNCFHPRWADHPLIFTFALKLKEGVRYELMARGSPPPPPPSRLPPSQPPPSRETLAPASRGLAGRRTSPSPSPSPPPPLPHSLPPFPHRSFTHPRSPPHLCPRPR